MVKFQTMPKKDLYYKGICDKLGPWPWGSFYAFSYGLGAAMALNTIFNAAAGRANVFHNSYDIAIAGLIGCIAGTAVHSVLNKVFAKNAVDTKKGGRIVKAAQAAVFAIPVAVGLAFNAVSDQDLEKVSHVPEPKIKQQQQFRSEPPEPARLPSQFLLS